jgi:hypothetical protein
MNNKDLMVETKWGILEPIQSNNLPICIDCGKEITDENRSGWECFTSDGRTTQPICIHCDKLRGVMFSKMNEGKK